MAKRQRRTDNRMAKRQRRTDNRMAKRQRRTDNRMWSKETRTKGQNNVLQIITQNTKDRVTRTPLKTGVNLVAPEG